MTSYFFLGYKILDIFSIVVILINIILKNRFEKIIFYCDFFFERNILLKLQRDEFFIQNKLK